MNTKDIRNLAAEARPVIDRGLDDAEILKGLSQAARDKGIDWTQLKALVKAQALDARDGGHRVGKLVERADFASSYAAVLASNMNEKDETRSSSLTETLAEAKKVSRKSTTANMAAQTKVAQALADEGLISQEAANETKAMAGLVAAKFGERADDGLDLPDFLDRSRETVPA